MSACIIYYSVTGNTETVAKAVAAMTGAKLVEIRETEERSKIDLYTKGVYQALSGKCTDIEPEIIDVSDYDCVVVGTPVWAGRPVPAINAAISSIKGCNGKDFVVYATYMKSASGTLEKLFDSCSKIGGNVKGSVGFSEKEVSDNEKIREIVELIVPE